MATIKNKRQPEWQIRHAHILELADKYRIPPEPVVTVRGRIKCEKRGNAIKIAQKIREHTLENI